MGCDSSLAMVVRNSCFTFSYTGVIRVESLLFSVKTVFVTVGVMKEICSDAIDLLYM